ncbi:hypothetical protein CCHR01_12328 [Colletotrichum chrysophilum]|uniref:Uncharacterized protein n=1 Tax=Colletotrichum chrysophilum TaxID=1836956 RepID=A0AAD9ABI1_9PEZI|nr:hypothetical protein CCHR01_12328 [Colletotrichum chrysophilum]
MMQASYGSQEVYGFDDPTGMVSRSGASTMQYRSAPYKYSRGDAHRVYGYTSTEIAVSQEAKPFLGPRISPGESLGSRSCVTVSPQRLGNRIYAGAGNAGPRFGVRKRGRSPYGVRSNSVAGGEALPKAMRGGASGFGHV